MIAWQASDTLNVWVGYAMEQAQHSSNASITAGVINTESANFHRHVLHGDQQRRFRP